MHTYIHKLGRIYTYIHTYIQFRYGHTKIVTDKYTRYIHTVLHFKACTLLCNALFTVLTIIICQRSFLISRNICGLEQPAASGSPLSEDAVYINGTNVMSCMYVCRYVCMYVCMYALLKVGPLGYCMWVYRIYLCMYVCMYVCTF